METKLPLGRMLAVFLAILIGGNVVLSGIEYAFPNLTLPNAIGVVFLMVSAMSAGQSVAGRMRRLLTAREKLVFALAATALCCLLALAVIWGVLTYVGVPFTLQNAVAALTGDMIPEAEIRAILPWVLLVGLGLNILIAYWFVGFGTRNMLTAIARKEGGSR